MAGRKRSVYDERAWDIPARFFCAVVRGKWLETQGTFRIL